MKQTLTRKGNPRQIGGTNRSFLRSWRRLTTMAPSDKEGVQRSNKQGGDHLMEAKDTADEGTHQRCLTRPALRWRDFCLCHVHHFKELMLLGAPQAKKYGSLVDE